MAISKASDPVINPGQFKALITPHLSKYVPRDHRPTPKQMVFMSVNVREAGYGGATGGGKSDALLMDALQNVHIPGSAALLLRRTFSDLALPGALMDRAHDWFGPTNAKWNDREKTWNFPTDGKHSSTLTFGFMETDKDRFRYQGSEFQYVGFDEATQFTELQYSYLFSRQRYTKIMLAEASKRGFEIVLKMRSASNPGGVGHAWYKRRFLTEGKAKGRIFVPSGLKDNPHLDAETYMEMLSELDPVTREQYINGNWDITEGGGMFERAWFTESRLDGRSRITAEVNTRNLNFVQIVRYWDFAGTKSTNINPDPDWTAGVKMGLTDDGRIFVLDVRRIRETPGEVHKFVAATAEDDGIEVLVRGEQEPGSAGVHFKADLQQNILLGFDSRFTKSTGKKDVRARSFSSQAYQGNVYLVNGKWLSDYLDELEQFGPDMKGGHDDMVDGSSGALQALKRATKFSVSNEASYTAEQAAIAKLEKAEQSESENGGFDSDDPARNPFYEAAMARGRAHGLDV